MKYYWWNFCLWLSLKIQPRRSWTVGYIIYSSDDGTILMLSTNKWKSSDRIVGYQDMLMANIVITTDGRVIKNRWGSVS